MTQYMNSERKQHMKDYWEDQIDRYNQSLEYIRQLRTAITTNGYAIANVQRRGRRLVAIPLSESNSGSTLPTQPEMLSAPTAPVSLPVLAIVTSVICIGGYVFKRFFRQQAKARRDSFGFLPDSQRPSLTRAELAV